MRYAVSAALVLAMISSTAFAGGDAVTVAEGKATSTPASVSQKNDDVTTPLKKNGNSANNTYRTAGGKLTARIAVPIS